MFIEFRKRICRRTAAAQIDLPEPVIQLVQSLLTSKEAARTTLLSKSWHSAWLTRLNLDFDYTYFCQSDSYSYADGFYPKLMEFAEKTLERYENSNLKIHSFRLSMKSIKHYSYDRATKLVCRALKLGPTHLTIQSEGFDIPDEVFRYENLVSLTVRGCRINLNPDDLCCSRLQFLSLESVKIDKHPDTTFHISKSCPLIEKLSLGSNSKGFESRVFVKRSKCLSASWFFRLSHILNKLKFSRISLSLQVYSRSTFDCEPGCIRGLPMSEIENLDVYHAHLPTLSCYALFDGLFRMCRPKVITQIMPYYNDRSIRRPEANNIRFLGKRLSDALDAKISTPGESQFMYGLNDLKEARIEVFDEDIGKWRSEETIDDALSNYKYLSVSTTPGGYRHQKVRFRLYWKL